jgi:hypothetical protein
MRRKFITASHVGTRLFLRNANKQILLAARRFSPRIAQRGVEPRAKLIEPRMGTDLHG